MPESIHERLDRMVQAGVSPEVAQCLHAYLDQATAPALMKMAPPRLAERWGLPPRDVLRAFLLGTRAGLFDLEWDVRCPSCTFTLRQADHLERLISSAHCRYCNIDVSAGLDDGIEVTFRLNPGARELPEVPLQEIIKTYVELEPGIPISAGPNQEVELDVEFTPGTWHLHSTDFCRATPIDVRVDDTIPPVLVITHDGQYVFREDNRPVGAGRVKVFLQNQSPETVSLEFSRNRDLPWLSGLDVASDQTFRDLFSTELVAAGKSFAIRSLCFVFTDIKGSTAMYERLGDSAAYTLVREHFAILRRVVDEHGGAIVKTIGDAIMATFTSPRAAVRAVFAMQDAFAAFNRREGTSEEVLIKVGAHHGPCIAVTSNDRLDYFGRTVNLAARIQGLSVGGDIVLSRSTALAPGVETLLATGDWTSQPSVASLKGIAEAYPVVTLGR